MTLTPAQHLLEWFTPHRRQLINSSALDRHAYRPIGNFSRFLNPQHYTSFERVDLTPYYPVLQRLGYLPPPETWTPKHSLSAIERSSNLRKWMTPLRRDLIKFKQLDSLSGRPLGIFSRYLSNEPHLTFKIIGIEVYYPMLQLFGFVPPARQMNTTLDSTPAGQHLLAWFTPERRNFIKLEAIDASTGFAVGTLARLLAGEAHTERIKVERFYPALRLLGYRRNLDLSQDESVQRYQAGQQTGPN